MLLRADKTRAPFSVEHNLLKWGVKRLPGGGSALAAFVH